MEMDLFNVTALRKTVYGFLSRGFAIEINQEYLDQIREYLPMLKELESTIEDLDYINGVKRLEEFVGKIENDKELIEEYERRFVSVFMHITSESDNVDPYESVYLSPEKLVMQEQRDCVLGFYARYGHGVDENFKEPEDHIAAELGFIGSLNNEILKDIEAGDKETEIMKKLEGQLEFMKRHLMLWLPNFSVDLKKTDPEGFYGILGELSLGFCRTDVPFLEELLEYLKNK